MLLHNGSEWATVLESFQALVGQESFSEFQFTKPIDQLRADLQQQLQGMPLSTSFTHENRKSIDVVLGGMSALSGLATVLAPTSPGIGAMIWESTRINITNSKSDTRLAVAVITHLKPISQNFQRFGRYLDLFPSCEHLRRAVEIFCHHVIDLLGYAVKSLQGPKYALPSQAYIEESLQKRVDLINQTSYQVEREAKAARFQADESWKQREHSLAPQQLKLPSIFSCFDIPMNRKFCGREDIMEKLHKHLIGPENNPLPGGSVLIHGLGGMGKSSIAVKFVYDHSDVYNPLIFWFPADNRQKAIATAARVCKELGINLGDPANELAKAAFAWRSWMEQNDAWLVVYDNVEDEDLLRDFWPRNHKGTIIVTSRRPNITGTLVESGLDIDQTMRTFDEMLKLLTEKRELLMRWPLPTDAVASLPLAMLWEADIASLPDAARSMLQVMAFLDPDNIQEEMLLDEKVLELHEVLWLLPADRETYLHCLRSLSNYSLIRRDRSMLCVHRLVQDATIFRMDQEDLRNALDAAVDLIWTVFPKQSQNGLLMSSVLHLAQNYLPHVEALGKRYHQLAASVNYKSLHLAELAYYCSWSMYERGMFGPSLKLARTGLDIAAALSCETRSLKANLWTVIGGVQLEGVDLEESYRSLKFALDLRLDAVQAGLMDEKHPQIANSYMRLGTAAVGIGRVQEALKLGEQSISQRLAIPDKQIQMLAMSHHNVALAALHSGQLDKADAFIKRSIELTSITSKSMTPDQKLAMDARNIYCQGNIFWARGMKEEAREYHHRALEARVRTFGEVHPYVACAYWKLGRIWEEDDWRKAETYYAESVKIYERLTMVGSHLGRVLLHLGRLRLKNGVPEGQESITQAGGLYQDITHEEFHIEHGDPFRKLV
ncbi:hypothetical protein F5144DRAFT_633667, partial [Chaetomium tenue]